MAALSLARRFGPSLFLAVDAAGATLTRAASALRVRRADRRTVFAAGLLAASEAVIVLALLALAGLAAGGAARPV